MALSDLFRFENPEVVAVVIGLLIFAILFSVLKSWFDRGTNIVISLILGFLGGYYLYRQGFYGFEQNLIAFFVGILVLAIIAHIAFGIGKRTYGFYKG